MPARKSVLFVCTGNTCRSPMAEGLFRHAVSDYNDIDVGSAGVFASKGSKASAETIKTLRKRNITLDSFQSRPVTESLIRNATHVFAMTEGHLAHLEERFPDSADKFYLLREFVQSGEKRIIKDVPDPIGMGLEAYEEVAQVIEKALPSLIAYVESVA
jgi:protein-tyrosine-phosphatase